MLKLYYLNITTWDGMCPGARHYYGRIHSDWKPDKCAERDSWDVEYKAAKPRGNFRVQFNSRQEVIHHAIKTFIAQKLFGILRIEDSSTCQPQRILICPKSVLEKAKQENRLWREMEEYYRLSGFGPKYGKRMDAINKEWQELWGLKYT